MIHATDEIQYFVDELAEALSRIDFTSQSLHAGQDNWVLDPEDGMYSFCGWIHPFIVKKHVVDLVREVWHLYDGIKEFVNAQWKAGLFIATNEDLDSGQGPGKFIANRHVQSSSAIKLCGDLANLSKHYRLTRATKTGDGPPVMGESIFVGTLSGKVQFLRSPNGERCIKVEKPVALRPTLVIQKEDGTQIGDAVDIALTAKDAWLVLLTELGCAFTAELRVA